MTTSVKTSSKERRSHIEAESDLFALPDIRRVRILGVNALGILHAYGERLLAILQNEGIVEVLLLSLRSAEFIRRRDQEEIWNGRISNRLEAEMEASKAILRDILNMLLQQHEHDIETLEKRFQIRLYDTKSDKGLLFVSTTKDEALLYRQLPRSSRLPRSHVGADPVSIELDPESKLYSRRLREFNEIWDSAEILSLDHLNSGVHIVNPRKIDAPDIYRQAVDVHEKRRLDEASALYDTVLSLESPKSPTEQQIFLAKRFLPRLNTTRNEPFELKDTVVVIHPDEENRLIGYHLIWEDDIDYLTDNDPADHEIVWVKYSEDLKVEAAWSFWHGEILSTSKAVADANRNNFRIQVHPQWGKHASLLLGWEEFIGIDASVAKHPNFESIEFSRLCKERKPAVGHYTERWPRRFIGDLGDFLDFSVVIDMEQKLAKHNMIIVSRFANAVITRHFLPYNIRPKIDWPMTSAGKSEFLNANRARGTQSSTDLLAKFLPADG